MTTRLILLIGFSLAPALWAGALFKKNDNVVYQAAIPIMSQEKVRISPRLRALKESSYDASSVTGPVLHAAVKANQFDLVEIFLRLGVSPDMRDPTNFDRTPLHIAPTTEMWDLLIKAKADPKLADLLGNLPYAPITPLSNPL
jgi:hypothetical protein